MSTGSATLPANGTIGARLGGLVLYVSLIGFVLDLSIRLASGVDDWKQTALDVGVLWPIGITGFILASGHLFMPARSRPASAGPRARSSGRSAWPIWPTGSWASLRRASTYTLAAIITFAIFLLGAALGHVRSMIRDHNFAPGNTGYVFRFDILAPVLLIVLHIATG
jgi:hypothetical protein